MKFEGDTQIIRRIKVALWVNLNIFKISDANKGCEQKGVFAVFSSGHGAHGHEGALLGCLDPN